jgi:hypothetical protein
MTERSYEDAVQALKRRFGGRWEGLEADGRDEMADILVDEMGYDRGTADQVIDSLVRSGQLRYQRGDDATLAGEEPAVLPAPIGTGMAAGTTGGSPTGVPVVPVANAGPGYWQIGDDGASGAPAGRAGQVDPTA